MSSDININYTNVEYLKFSEPHLALQAAEFLHQRSNTPHIQTIYRNLVACSQDYDKQKSLSIFTDAEIADNKQRNQQTEEDLESQLHGFLNLCQNCKQQNNYDINAFALGKKIIDETNPILIIDLAKRLFDSGKYDKAKAILYAYAMLNESNKKNISKSIFAFYLIYSINIVTKQSPKTIENSFIQILAGVEKLKNHLDEEFKKLNFESVDKIPIDFKHILLYRGYIIHWALYLLENNIEIFLDTLLDDKYFMLIESVFPYMFKYLIVFTVITKSKKYLHKLKEFLRKNDAFGKDELFVSTFKNAFIDYAGFDVIAKQLHQSECAMKEDYFMHAYVNAFSAKCKEMIVENYVLTNEDVDVKEVSALFGGDEDKAKGIVGDVVRFIYPQAKVVDNGDGVMKYDMEDNDGDCYYKIQTEELFKLTKGMVEFINMNDSNYNE